MAIYKKMRTALGDSTELSHKVYVDGDEGAGTTDYIKLDNKPSINGVVLEGDVSLDDLGIDQDFVKDNDYVHTDNNYSTEEKEKLSGLENYDDAEIRGLINSKQPAGDYALRSDIPDVSNFITKTVADLVNYYNKNETYTQTEIKALIEAVKTIDMEIVPAKPDEPKSNIIYLIPNGKAGDNIYDEYVYVNDKWELIGSTDIDLSNYYNKAEIDAKINIDLSEEEKYTDMQTFANNLIGDFTASLNEKQNIIADLEDIRDGALKGSTALQSVPAEYITETELNNYHDNTKQDELIAGENITIENNVISATNSGAVNSVNGKTGDVVLNADEVGALPNTTKIPTKTSDIENDSGYVKDTDYATEDKAGVVKIKDVQGIGMTSTKYLTIKSASSASIKAGSNINQPIIPEKQHESVFYGLAKASGDTTQSVSRNAVGTYTNEAKASIKNMLGIDLSNKADKIEVIENTDATELQPNKYYKWGEVASLSLTLGTPIDGILNEYMFEFISGATPITLTLPDTIKWETIPTIEANKKYQISIVNNVALIVGV